MTNKQWIRDFRAYVDSIVSGKPMAHAGAMQAPSMEASILSEATTWNADARSDRKVVFQKEKKLVKCRICHEPTIPVGHSKMCGECYREWERKREEAEEKRREEKERRRKDAQISVEERAAMRQEASREKTRRRLEQRKAARDLAAKELADAIALERDGKESGWTGARCLDCLEPISTKHGKKRCAPCQKKAKRAQAKERWRRMHESEKLLSSMALPGADVFTISVREMPEKFCEGCGERIFGHRTRWCVSCAAVQRSERRRTYQKKRTEQRRIAREKQPAKCALCDSPRAPGNKKYCAEHSLDARAGRLSRRERASKPCHSGDGKTRYQRLLEAGLCTSCGKVPPVEGKTVCQPCREKRNAHAKGRTAELREAGLCITCGRNPPDDGSSRCRECLDSMLRTQKELRLERIAEGVCVKCREPLDSDRSTSMCSRCLAVSRKRSMELRERRRQAWEEDGTCAFCGKRQAEPGKKMCLQCISYHSNFKSKKRLSRRGGGDD